MCSRILDKLGDADVLCLQEDMVRVRVMDGAVVSEPLPLDGYRLVAQCLGESMGQTGGRRADERQEYRLANSTYVRTGLGVGACTVVDLPVHSLEVPRCAAVAEVQGIRVANVHLSGGRYDDKYADSIRDIKEAQLEAVLALRPHVVVGDFNGQPQVPKTPSMDAYISSLRVTEGGFAAMFTGGHALLRRSGYAAALLAEASATSIFGTVPDWVYYLPPRLQPTRIRVEDFTSGDLTDHNAVVVTFRIRE